MMDKILFIYSVQYFFYSPHLSIFQSDLNTMWVWRRLRQQVLNYSFSEHPVSLVFFKYDVNSLSDFNIASFSSVHPSILILWFLNSAMSPALIFFLRWSSTFPLTSTSPWSILIWASPPDPTKFRSFSNLSKGINSLPSISLYVDMDGFGVI